MTKRKPSYEQALALERAQAAARAARRARRVEPKPEPEPEPQRETPEERAAREFEENVAWLKRTRPLD